MDFLKANVTLNSEDIGKLIENEDIYIADVEFNQNLQVISIKILTQNGIGRLEYIPEKKEVVVVVEYSENILKSLCSLLRC